MLSRLIVKINLFLSLVEIHCMSRSQWKIGQKCCQGGGGRRNETERQAGARKGAVHFAREGGQPQVALGNEGDE